MFATTIHPGHLPLAELRRAYHEPVRITLADQAYAAIDRSVACVNRIVEENRTVYGINTGFGLLASTRIACEDLEKLQRSIVLSHAAGVGEALDDATVRLIMLLKINSLARGFSGVRRVVLEHLMALVNAEVYPHIPLKGSVGASGDLAPLAHMSLLLLARARRATTANGCRPNKPWPKPVSPPSNWRPKKAWPCSTAPRFPPPSPCAACLKRKICLPRRWCAVR